MATIALITDYGTSDWFAGEMKAAILRIMPGATLIDITHDIEPGAVKSAAFTLSACYRTFPEGTVFCVVVDPGVGTARAALAIKTGAYYLVGPDNGVLSWVTRNDTNAQIRNVDCPALLPQNISNTFHGRDIFGPVAAHLARGAAFEAMGPLTTDIVELPWPAAIVDTTGITGFIVHIDRFGNAITSIDRTALAGLPESTTVYLVKYGTELPLCTHFQQVPTGQGLAYAGSSGYLEVAINNANAAAVFGLHVGDAVAVRAESR